MVIAEITTHNRGRRPALKTRTTQDKPPGTGLRTSSAAPFEGLVLA